MISTWHSLYLTQLSCLPFAQLDSLFSLSAYPNWLNAAGLNGLKTNFCADITALPDFVCQSTLADSNDYYEQIIFKQQQIPTRPDNWHDLFNGLIWLQFPRIKQVLNQLHIEDITQHGLSPRTLRRNNLTHFDECGVILAVEEGHEFLFELLRQHQWHEVFIEHKVLWGTSIVPFMFGHANLEMLLQPFVGLTGKWLGIVVPKGFSDLAPKQQLSLLDTKLAEQINQDDLFAQKKALLPLPLLGIPGYCMENQDVSYYQNTDYFRPKTRRV